MRTLRTVGIVITVSALVAWAAPASAVSPTTTRVSISTAGEQGDDISAGSVISGSGRYVAFNSNATTLVAGDTNGVPDVFVRDRRTGTTTRVSVASDGTQANSSSAVFAISPDGRYVGFTSSASNLVPGDANGGVMDVFLRDRQLGTTTLVGVANTDVQVNDASQGLAMSDDARLIVFRSESPDLVDGDTNGAMDIFVRDRTAGTTTRANVSSAEAQANGLSTDAAISSDGRFVTFDSNATNLVSGDTNGHRDVFVRDRAAGTTSRVSLRSNGAQGNGDSGIFGLAINTGGRFVAFVSDATNLVSGDTNGKQDVFVRDRQTGTTSRVSVSSSGHQGASHSRSPSISGDGRYVAFDSVSSAFVAGDTNQARDVFLRDRTAGTTIRVSVSSNGAQGNADSDAPRIGGGGRFVTFTSFASNLVAGDTNGNWDVFVRDRG